MSVMLATTNPEAASEYQNRDTRRPYAGQSVVFHCRPGEGRAGKISAPAIVHSVFDDDHVDLVVIFDADDLGTRMKIPRKTEQNPFNAWAFNEQDDKHYLRPLDLPPPAIARDEFLDLSEEVKKLNRELSVLRNVVNERKK